MHSRLKVSARHANSHMWPRYTRLCCFQNVIDSFCWLLHSFVFNWIKAGEPGYKTSEIANLHCRYKGSYRLPKFKTTCNPSLHVIMEVKRYACKMLGDICFPYYTYSDVFKCTTLKLKVSRALTVLLPNKSVLTLRSFPGVALRASTLNLTLDLLSSFTTWADIE